ncbi:MAG TPA: MFS transporter [Pyrinomonadaceae bacterium]
MTTPKVGRIFYGWIIVAVATLALVISNGLSIGGIPVFYKSIREDFVANGAVDAANAESFIAFGATLTFFFAGILSPVAGWLIQRFRLRNLMLIGCAMLGGALVVHSQTSNVTVVYAARTVMGISLCLVGVLPSIVLVSNWFVRRRGLALGILLTGTSIGGVVIPQIATPLIAAYGWRSAMVVVSLLVWLMLVPAVLFFVKDKPVDIGMLPDGDVFVKDAAPVAVAGLTLAEALRTPLFWTLALCAAAVFYPIFVSTQQFILQATKIGLSPQQASLGLSTLFFVSVSGKFLFGFFSDRFPPTQVMMACCFVMFASTLVLLNLSQATVFLFLVPFGFGYGGTFVLLQRIAADYFGNRDYPKILGVLIVIETVGASIGGLVTGRLADAAGGDYTTAFYAVIGVSGVAFFLTIILSYLSRSLSPTRSLTN